MQTRIRRLNRAADGLAAGRGRRANPSLLHIPHWLRPGGVPHWYFGWNIVAATTVLVLLSVGLRLAVGPFFLPIVKDMNVSRSLLSSIVAAGMLVYGLVMPGVGWLVARVGTRAVILAGTALIVAGGVGSALAQSTLGFTFWFAVVLSLGTALVSPVTVTQIVSSWFVRQRGMALFFLSTGGMAGLAVVTPALAWSISHAGWRWTLGGYVLVVAAISVPSALLVLRDQAPAGADGAGAAPQPAAPGAQGGGAAGVWRALGTRPFWLLTIGLMANGYSMTLLGTHGIPMLVDHHFGAQTAALGVGLIGLVAIAGTVMLGRVADRWPRKYLLATVYFVRGAAFLALPLVMTAGQLYAVAIVGGLVWAGAMALSSAMMADLYGVRLISVLYGIAYVFQQLAGMFAAWLGGWGYETFATHWVSFGASAVILFTAGWTVLHLPGGRGAAALVHVAHGSP